MVKNVTGGNKAKQAGRKNLNEASRRVRYVENEGEIYGIAIKMLGSGQFHVKCNDDITRLCIIRGKFSGRNKQSSIVRPGTWVMVGIYDWQADSDKMQKCDLLEVYQSSDQDKLLQTATNFTVLKKEQNIMEDLTEETDNIVFDVNVDDI